MPISPTTPSYPALVIDGSSTEFFSGILGSEGRWLSSKKAAEPALESLFETVDAVLGSADQKLDHIQSFLYCEGPGSVLGLRLCAMAIETWMRIHPAQTGLYAYNSLKLVAAGLVKEKGLRDDALLISDWKKDTWNGLRIISGEPTGVGPVSAETLSQWEGPLYHLPARKGWQKPPENTIEVAYEPERLGELLAYPGLIERRERVDLYGSGINTFQKWTPERHRASSTAQ
jgi:tRNA threonylcarbamoyladenosine biosynthesis protein TsaB